MDLFTYDIYVLISFSNLNGYLYEYLPAYLFFKCIMYTIINIKLTFFSTKNYNILMHTG